MLFLMCSASRCPSGWVACLTGLKLDLGHFWEGRELLSFGEVIQSEGFHFLGIVWRWFEKSAAPGILHHL